MSLRMRVHDREPIGAALRRFKKLLERSGVTKELRKRSHYEKPCDLRRRAKARKQSVSARHEKIVVLEEEEGAEIGHAAECEKRTVEALEFTGIAKDGENDRPARAIKLDAANADVNFNRTPVGPPDFELNAVRLAVRKPRPKDSGVGLTFTIGK